MRVILLWALSGCLLAMQGLASAPEARVFEFSYEVLPAGFPPGEAVDIYIPLPAEHAGQRILSQSLQSSLPGESGLELVHGNCTDFHALFVSLARSEGIPARFEIGFPIPLERSSGDIGGYHCWVQFYLPEQGWIPIDASEAAKHPERREMFYGSHPADRIHFTTGRDLVMSEGSAAMPLNYFIYPYVEVGGKPWREKLETRFAYTGVAMP